ncbi:hypothetical protein G6F57_019291 [Rhizopus arrhizus]|nr:hypothetical protein G6F57_019291 [Rhizopus arrhizus]
MAAQARQVADGQVGLAVFQRLGQLLQRNFQHLDLQAWGQRMHAFHQERQEDHFTDIRHGQPEAPGAGGGVETLPQADGFGKAVHAAFDRAGQRKGDGRGLHAGGGAHEQGVVETLAQPGQRIADCRLRQVQPLRRARHAAFMQHGQENPHEIQVEVHACP